MACSPFAPFLNGDSRGHPVALGPFPPFLIGDNGRHAVARAPFPFLNSPAHGCRPAKGSPFVRDRVFMGAAPAGTGVRSVVGWVRRLRSEGSPILLESRALCQEHFVPFSTRGSHPASVCRGQRPGKPRTTLPRTTHARHRVFLAPPLDITPLAWCNSPVALTQGVPMPPLPTNLSPPSAGPRLLDRLRAACRVRHYSLRTEDAYAQWVRRFILFHGKRHPQE